jgi:hypothetical protein
MIATFTPMLGSFVAGAYPKPAIFKQKLESKPGPTDAYSLLALGIELTMSAVPGVFINVDLQWKSLQKGIEQLEKANVLLGEGNVSLEAALGSLLSQQTREQQIAEKAGETSEQRLAAFAAEESIGNQKEQVKYQIKVNNQAKEQNLHQIEILKVEQKQLGSKEAAELYHSFQPLVVTARLIKGMEGETVWLGTLTPTVIPSGSLINEVVVINGFHYKVYAYEEAYFTLEVHQPITPTTIEGDDPPLILEITVQGPTEWEAGEEKSGVGMFRAKGKEKNGVKKFAEIKEKQVAEATAANLVEILSCTLLANYQHEP